MYRLANRPIRPAAQGYILELPHPAVLWSMLNIPASRWALGAHLSTALLTTAMLIFTGVSGPATKYWSFRIVYTGKLQSSDILTRAQEEWRVGGLGSCLAGNG